ncbi:hypothetical protein [Microvirga lotononidis]|uniref:Uncharacterized protein n=1 Tax=Microvirga lotononidis TaxID=864069 RepID=I4YMX2_9HYPH|nr:hypothetical protein [Microvirga lotononidis]EIM25314.1 hypothetical protein MicloDRAFT_00060390 [Microvirga lotononidis]WQO27383.1 hypothetical protein U0023_22535 [Microvirga lotononidis]
MNSRLNNAVQNAYEAFGWRSLSGLLEVCHCECCMSEVMAESILKTPLRELSNEQLSEYTNSAHGWSDQFLTLLPRYMDLISRGERPTDLDPDHILSRFRYAPENFLTDFEFAAFSEWFMALFEEALCRTISSNELDCALSAQSKSWWEGFGNDVCEIIEIALPTPFDSTQFLKRWEACEAREANLRLASTLIFGIGAKKFRKSNHWSERAEEQAARWHSWFTLQDHTGKLGEAIERESDPKVQEFLMAAL